MLHSRNKKIIHHASSKYGITEFFNQAIALARYEQQTLNCCWDGTLVKVSPKAEETIQSIYKKWVEQRKDYQSSKKDDHPAICPECDTKAKYRQGTTKTR